MAIKTLPGFKSLSEFGQYHGDCGECATLGVLHSLDPVRYPLTLTALNHITSDAIAHGEADASLSGGMNIPHLDAMLTRLGIPHLTIGYGGFNLDTFHGDLKTHAGVHGVVVEWSQGGALPGDESGVHYHYSACGGINTGPAGDGIGGGYLWCDGDNNASTKADGGSSPILYTWQQVVAAGPIAYIVVLSAGSTTGAPGWKLDLNAAGQLVGAHDDKGHTVGAGFADLLRRLNLLSTDGLTSEKYYDKTHSVCGLSNDMLLLYDAVSDTSVSATHGGAFAADMLGLLATAQTTIQQLQAQLAAAQKDSVFGAAVRGALVANGFTHS